MSKNYGKEVEIIDGKGYYSEQFLCRQASTSNLSVSRESILDQIYLAVNLIEEMSPKGLDSSVLDVSTDVSGMPSQLKVRGFKDVAAVPESNNTAQALKEEIKAENWRVNLDMGLQKDFLKLSNKSIEKKVDVILFMDSNFGRFKSKKEQVETLKKCQEFLSKDGILILDLSNPMERIRNISLEPTWLEDENYYHLNRESIDPYTFEYKTTHIEIPKEKGEKTSRTETGILITLPYLNELFEETNFTVKKIFGNYDQDSLTPQSPRMIVIAKKGDC